MTEYERLISHMGLEMDMKLNSLSSGMSAKLKLAATMARDAKLFMLDEPLNGIDPCRARPNNGIDYKKGE